MNYTITDNRLLEVFSNVMENFSNLQEAERSYDYYEYEKNRYVDFNVYNYYDNIDEDWEEDAWILQAQYEKGDYGDRFELPILRYVEWAGEGTFMSVKSMFGDYFEPLLKEWFNSTYPVKKPIKTVTKEQD